MSEPKTHELKIEPEYFQEVFMGHKNFEIRKNDRHFNVGDTVILNEWVSQKYTGRKLAGRITYITDYMQRDGYVVFGMGGAVE